MNLQLEEFYEHLNEAVITTNDFEDGTKFRKKEKVKEFAYCGLNPMYRHYLSFDLDFIGAALKYEESNLPPPTIITINKANAHCHYLYKLKTPVAYHQSSRSKPQDYFKAIEDAMTKSLDADQAFNHTITKNPLHEKWRVLTNPVAYDLNDFQEYLDISKRKTLTVPSSKNNQKGYLGRNDELFEYLRKWAYPIVREFISEKSWSDAVHAQACEYNATFAQGLPHKEVRNTANSIAKWTWKNRFNFMQRTKVLEFTNETPHERMSQGAKYTNEIRTQKTLKLIRESIIHLNQTGIPITPISVQVHSGLNIKTVRKYLKSAQKNT